MQQFLLLAIGMLALLPAIAGTTGSVSGLVKDRMGMPVAGAKVTLVEIAKGTSIGSKTDRNGSYTDSLWFYPGLINFTRKQKDLPRRPPRCSGTR
jgi:hypothetical protein